MRKFLTIESFYKLFEGSAYKCRSITLGLTPTNLIAANFSINVDVDQEFFSTNISYDDTNKSVLLVTSVSEKRLKLCMKVRIP